MKRWLAVILAAVIACFALLSCGSDADRWAGTAYFNKVDASTMNLGGKPLYPSSHAELYLNAGASVDILSAGTYYMVDGASTIYETEDFDNTGTTTRLTYIGADTKHFLIVVSLSVECDTVNTLTTWNVYENGSPHVSTAISNLIGTPGDDVALTMNNLEQLSTGDYFEIYVTANKACTLTVKYMTIDVVSVN